MKKLIILLCGLLALSACKDDNDEPTPDNTPKRTVIVYMAADNNLTNYAEYDLQEMLTGSEALGTNDQLVVFVDKADSQQLPYIARIAKGEATMEQTFDEELFSADPQKFYEVLRQIITSYPAEDYGLVLWGHANGAVIERDSIAGGIRRAYGRDNDNNQLKDGVWMNIPSMREALSALNIKWKFIMSDCCNMQSAEVAYELRQLADYLIATPAEIPGMGAPYDLIVPDMFNRSENFYKQIVDDYAESTYDHVPLSVVKTSEVEHLAQATRTALLSINPAKDENDPDMSGLIYYWGSNSKNIQVLYDMNDYMLKFAPAEVYSAWKAVFDQTVVYKRIATRWDTMELVDFSRFTVTDEKLGGLSMFTPLNVYEQIGRSWNETFHQLGWYYASGWSELGW